MELNNDTCYQALLAHDRRFDGVFFVCVSSTGIYCRPVCTAKMPKRENCTFHRSAAAAERAGYRPCLRCRPELAPVQRPLQGALSSESDRSSESSEDYLEDGSARVRGGVSPAAGLGRPAGLPARARLPGRRSRRGRSLPQNDHYSVGTAQSNG